MRICYVLLSATFGMHQYSADLANRMAKADHEVHLVTTTHAPRDRYGPGVRLHTPISTTSTGFSVESLQLLALARARRTIQSLAPDVIHFTGPHLWNVFLMQALGMRNIPLVHTIHDLHPHAGAFYGRLLYLWNRSVRSSANHLLVHGQRYQDEMLAQGIEPPQVTCTPLMHLFLGHEQDRRLSQSPPAIQYEPWALFFARFEVYKGLPILIEAARRIRPNMQASPCMILAGQGRLEDLNLGPIPRNVEVRNRLIADQEAIDLFSRCGVVVLPYIEASQSALIAAAYYFRKPVIVTHTGALPEYVVEGETGWIVPPGNPTALAEAMQAALNDPAQLEGMGQAGRAWYERQRQAEGDTLQGMYDRLAGHGTDR